MKTIRGENYLEVSDLESTNIILNEKTDEYWIYTAVVMVYKEDMGNWNEMMDELKEDNNFMEDFCNFSTIMVFEDNNDSGDDMIKFDCFYVSETKSYKRQWNTAVKELLEYINCYA